MIRRQLNRPTQHEQSGMMLPMKINGKDFKIFPDTGADHCLAGREHIAMITGGRKLEPLEKNGGLKPINKRPIPLAGKMTSCELESKTTKINDTFFFMDAKMGGPPIAREKALLELGYLRWDPDAASRGLYRMVTVLVNRLSVYPLSKDLKGRTALDIALAAGHIKVANFLHHEDNHDPCQNYTRFGGRNNRLLVRTNPKIKVTEKAQKMAVLEFDMTKHGSHMTFLIDCPLHWLKPECKPY